VVTEIKVTRCKSCKRLEIYDEDRIWNW